MDTIEAANVNFSYWSTSVNIVISTDFSVMLLIYAVYVSGHSTSCLS